jgi:penicillin-binding protein 1C
MAMDRTAAVEQAGRTRGRRARRLAGWALGTVAGLVLAAWSAWAWLRHLGRVDERRLLPERLSTVYTDRAGTPLRIELGAEDQWQIAVPLVRMSPWLVHGAVAEEDKRFWQHGGVDWLAAARAAGSNLRAGRIVSGASTLTMQLARLACPERRGWRAKGLQVLRAWDLETRHPKEWILEQYLNQAPFGGNLVGVEAAARAYFGKPAADLGLAEAALLIGLPQRPAAYRPDRHPERARERRRSVLGQFVAAGLIPASRAREADALPLGVVPRRPGEPPPGLPRGEPLFCAAVAGASPRRGGPVVTTLDRQWQDIALTALRNQVARLPEVSDGAAVILENASGAVRAMVGTLDPEAPGNGRVDASRRPRSPGSALKPFIALAAIDAGVALPETRLADEPLVYGGYRPGNYDGQYHGTVTLREALSRSLNTPAVRLLQEVGPETAHALMLRCGLRSLARRSPAELHLTLALGSGEVALLELTDAYAALARGGRSRVPQLVEAGPPGADLQASSPGAATLVLDMLASQPLPGAADIPAAWKTGTSNGHRDAWCLAVNRDLAIGVWLGNKSGRPAASLVGITAAAPVVADILRRVYAGTQPAPLPAPAGTESVRLCRVSGLTAGFACRAAQPGLRVAGIPVRLCRTCANRADEAVGDTAAAPPTPTGPPRILLPRPGDYLAEGPALRLSFTSAREETLLWYVDGRFVGQFASRDAVQLERGTHSVQGIRPGTSHGDRIWVRVD